MAYLIGRFAALKKANGITAKVSKAIIPMNNFSWSGFSPKSKILIKKSDKLKTTVTKISAETKTVINAVETKESFFFSDL